MGNRPQIWMPASRTVRPPVATLECSHHRTEEDIRMTAASVRSAHVVSLLASTDVEQSDLGSIHRVTADSFPILRGMSIKRLVLNPGAMRTPHWHANANELTYCVSGTALA